MAQRSQIFQVFPWAGGLNLSDDKAFVGPSDFTILQNVDVSVRNTKKQRDGVDNNWDAASTTNDPIRALTDYWYESSGAKTQRTVAIRESGSITSNQDSETQTDISDTTNPWSDVTRATTVVVGNYLLLGAEGPGNEIKIWDGSTSTAVDIDQYNQFDAADQNPPPGWVLQRHLNRVWTNSKDEPDRLHYSETDNPFKWQGSGDSGALWIGRGDGDPEGIVAIFPTFKGQLFVAKRTKLYRISGTTPETFAVELVSDSIGCVSPQAVAQVDTDDIYWFSERGCHSLLATDTFGDFNSTFISLPIQRDFLTRVNRSRLQNIQGRYLPDTNSVAFAISPSGSAENTEIWWYHVVFKFWYYWTGIDAESIAKVQDFDKERFYFGRSDGRIAQAQSNRLSDVDSDGNKTAIDFRLKTGVVYTDNTPVKTKGYKSASIIYRPEDKHTLTVNFTTDARGTQTFNVSTPTEVPLLGSTFILGESVLGSAGITAPYTFTIDGYGRGFELEIRNNEIDETVEVLGYAVEWEEAGAPKEVRNS